MLLLRVGDFKASSLSADIRAQTDENYITHSGISVGFFNPRRAILLALLMGRIMSQRERRYYIHKSYQEDHACSSPLILKYGEATSERLADISAAEVIGKNAVHRRHDDDQRRYADEGEASDDGDESLYASLTQIAQPPRGGSDGRAAGRLGHSGPVSTNPPEFPH